MKHSLHTLQIMKLGAESSIKRGDNVNRQILFLERVNALIVVQTHLEQLEKEFEEEYGSHSHKPLAQNT